MRVSVRTESPIAVPTGTRRCRACAMGAALFSPRFAIVRAPARPAFVGFAAFAAFAAFADLADLAVFAS